MAFMQVSRKVDYALRAVIHLANEEASDRACSVAEIAERERVPRQFLEKIVQEMIHEGLVRSRRVPGQQPAIAGAGVSGPQQQHRERPVAGRQHYNVDCRGKRANGWPRRDKRALTHALELVTICY